LGSAFLDFAINKWRRTLVHPTVLHRFQKSGPKRFITIAEFGELYGLGRRTNKRMLAMKIIPTITIRTGQTVRQLIDLQQLHEPPTVPGRIVTRQAAAARIGVSARVLSKLRASGHFEVKYLVRRNGYHERDIKQFIERLLDLNPNSMNRALPPDCITLYQAMCRYHGTGEGGASIIRALLSGQLRVMGNVDGTVRGLFLSRAEFQQFGRNERAQQKGNVRTAWEVAKEIHCDKLCVPHLVGRKLLYGWDTPTGWQISEESIAKFKQKYASLVSIAGEIGTNSSGLMRHCAAKHIPMILMKYRSEEIKQAFVRLRDRDAVLSFRPRRVKRRDLGPSLFPDVEPVEQLPKQSSRPATARVRRRDLGPSLFLDLETVEQLPKRASKPATPPVAELQHHLA
jgi:hypothetical protein